MSQGMVYMLFLPNGTTLKNKEWTKKKKRREMRDEESVDEQTVK